MRTERIRTDVLIIGGGTAGCFAAYVIGKKSGRKVLIAEKANIKRSGCLAAGVNALNAYITEGRVPQDYVDYAKKDAHGIVREDLLLDKEELEAVDIMRKALNSLKTDEAAERILDLFTKTRNNDEFVKTIIKNRYV